MNFFSPSATKLFIEKLGRSLAKELFFGFEDLQREIDSLKKKIDKLEKDKVSVTKIMPDTDWQANDPDSIWPKDCEKNVDKTKHIADNISVGSYDHVGQDPLSPTDEVE